MENPWPDYAAEKLSDLSHPTKTPVGNLTYDFVLPADRLMYSDFDGIYTRPLCLQTYLPPVPYVGNPEEAEIILLAANPGFVERKTAEYENNLLFVEQSLKSLMFESDYPIHYLDERFASYPGFKWWEQAIADIVDQAVGNHGEKHPRRKQITKKIAGVEWLPYHSNSFDKSSRNEIFSYTLSSQHYTKWVVDKAIERNAQLVVIYGRPHREMWERFLGKPFPPSTIFKSEKCRVGMCKRLRTPYFEEHDLDRLVGLLAK